MARSLALLGVAAVASALSVPRTPVTAYQLTEEYYYLNFFDKFNFFVSNHNTGNNRDIDPTAGFTNYTSRIAAEQLGLIGTRGTDAYIGVEHTRWVNAGRESVRLESKTSYNSGLIIATFNHLPKPVCGAWPAFWMYGPNWPTNGELDIYEQWNLADGNAVTAHTDGGECKIQTPDFSGTAETRNCAYNAPEQYHNQGCSVKEPSGGQWGKANGGTCKWCSPACLRIT